MTIHICRGTNVRYLAQVRFSGGRHWHRVSEHKSKTRALLAMARRFAKNYYKRGRVLMTADYYEPVIVAEMKR